MFGYVSLGGDQLKAFFWNTESPEWYECVVLYSEAALKHQVVSLHFRVLSNRVTLDAQIETELTSRDSKIVEACREKLANDEKIGRKVRFSTVDLIDAADRQSEIAMQMELDVMLQEDTDNEFWSEDEEAQNFELGCFYSAEIFGGKFIESDTESYNGSYIRKTSSIKQHMLQQLINDTPSPLLAKFSSELTYQNPLCQTPNMSTPVDPELTAQWEMDDEKFISDDEDEAVFEKMFDTRSSKTFAHCQTEPVLSTGRYETPRELERQPAFISTKGKEREFWNTYREEITATWKADLEQLRRELCVQP